MSREVGGYPLRLLLRLLNGIASNKFVLLELHHDIWLRVRGAHIEAARLNQLDVNLTLGRTG